MQGAAKLGLSSQYSLDETSYHIQLGGKAMSMASKYVPLNPCATVQVLSSGVKSAPTLKDFPSENQVGHKPQTCFP